jgi:hypothetical protein
MDKENIKFYMATHHWLCDPLRFISYFVPMDACSGYALNGDPLY